MKKLSIFAVAVLGVALATSPSFAQEKKNIRMVFVSLAWNSEIPFRAALARGDKPGDRPRVVVSTIHGSKGAEADHVVVLKDMAKRTHREMEQLVDDEVRVWYVAVTRAKRRLTIVESQTAQECPWL